MFPPLEPVFLKNLTKRFRFLSLYFRAYYFRFVFVFLKCKQKMIASSACHLMLDGSSSHFLFIALSPNMQSRLVNTGKEEKKERNELYLSV